MAKPDDAVKEEDLDFCNCCSRAGTNFTSCNTCREVYCSSCGNEGQCDLCWVEAGDRA